MPGEAEAANWIAWARKPGHDSYWRFHRDAFLPTLPPPPRRVVDVGCGEGRLPRDLKRLGYDVIGVDGSAALITAAREADPDGRYEVADGAALPLPGGSADLVTAFMSLHDMDDLDGKYQFLRSKLDEAYKAPVWDSERIDRIADEIIPVERELASIRARDGGRKENRHA